MTRRDFLKYVGGVAGGLGIAAVTGVLGSRAGASSPVGSQSAAGASAQASGASLADFTYKGRHIQIEQMGADVMLRLDGRDLPHHYLARSGDGFCSHLMPYHTDASPIPIARELVDGDGTLFIL